MSQPSSNQVAVYNRLAELNISNYNQHKHVASVLGDVVSPDETIQAAVVGRNANRTSALFALTNSRLIYIEGDKLYHATNEVTLDSISGVTLLPTPLLSSVTVKTRSGDYSIQDINNANSQDFVSALDATITKIEQEQSGQIQKGVSTPTQTPTSPTAQEQEQDAPSSPVAQFSEAELNFLSSQSTGILSTSSLNGQIHSNPIYYTVKNSSVYIMTREQTHKAQNMLSRPQAVLVILDKNSLDYINVSSIAEEIKDTTIQQEIYNSINALVTDKKEGTIQKALYDTSKGGYAIFKLSPVTIASNL